jgi:glycine/D-amino acid oxidase-like deaminating enzyme
MIGPRVVIVGAGIVGAACARALTLAGARVTVCAKSLAGGATAAGMGHVVVMDDSEAQFALCRYSQQLWDELAPSLPAEAEWLRCGTLWVAADDEEMAEIERKRAFYAERGAPARVLSGRQLAEEEPNLRPGLAGGLLLPADSVIYPPVAARCLLDEAVRSGAEMKLGAAVTALDGRSATLADGSRVEGDLTVNAAGALAPALTPGLPVRPRKGHLVITDRYPGFVRHQLIELGYLKNAHHSEADSVAFNVQPRSTGQLLLGSSRQFEDTSDVDRGLLGRMIERALEYMPGLARLSAIRAWTGLRAATPDSLPLIGPHPEAPGLYLATGHEGLGITTSLGTAALLADLVMGRPPAIPAAPYSPARFKVPCHVG